MPPTVVAMSAAETIYRSCVGCGVTFGQPNDPGRKRRYHDDACKQRAYRQRHGGGTRGESRQQRQRREEAEAWAREEARREQERQRSERRRNRQQRQARSEDRWTWPNPADDAATAKRRRT